MGEGGGEKTGAVGMMRVATPPGGDPKKLSDHCAVKEPKKEKKKRTTTINNTRHLDKTVKRVFGTEGEEGKSGQEIAFREGDKKGGGVYLHLKKT